MHGDTESGISSASRRRNQKNRPIYFSFVAADGEELALPWTDNLCAKQMSPSETKSTETYDKLEKKGVLEKMRGMEWD